MVDKKDPRIILSQESYWLYPAGIGIFRVNNSKIRRLSFKVLVPHEFACWVLLCFINHVIIFFSDTVKKQPPEVFCKKVFLEISQILTGKHLCQRFSTLLKKRLWRRYFPVNFAKLLRIPFSQNTSGRLLTVVNRSSSKSVFLKMLKIPLENTCFNSVFELV